MTGQDTSEERQRNHGRRRGQNHVQEVRVRYPETGDSLMMQLAAAVGLEPDWRSVYGRYADVLLRFLDQRTAASPLNFSGPFAKMDHLLKEAKAQRQLSMAANAARVRIRRRGDVSGDELRESCRHDLKALCRFIALVDGTPIPASVSALLPADDAVRHAAPRLLTECMRMIVSLWDDDMIYGTIDGYGDGRDSRVCYSHGNRYYDFDWTYLRPMLHAGMQLNLVRPRLDDDGTIMPELIIVEPDYLVDVTSVARCFTHYADSPLVNVVRRLMPAAGSEAIEIGNFAGQLLDEELHRQDGGRTYRDSVTDFFRHNALDLLTAGIGTTFHTEAQRQKQHIEDALGRWLPQEVSSFDPKEGITEPSFVSETLGLQGRMDFLQLDYKVLIEQKSGKGRFPYDGFVHPQQTDDHYVQLLLYMLLIRYDRRDRYEANGGELHAFLLYSKYSQSLLALGMAPEKIFEAIKVRNGIAWTEMRLAADGEWRMLDRLTPERLNEKGVADRLWRSYQRPQIAAVLDTVHHASELEKAYFFRFLTFISNEHVLAKLGNKTKENSGFASTWQNSADEKRHAGNIYDRLTLVSPDGSTEGRITEVKLRFSDDTDNDLCNFRTGDIVLLYPYRDGEEPDARRTMVVRCSIKDITADGHIILTLRAPQSDARIFTRQDGGRLWAIEHDFMEASFASLYRGMLAFLKAPKERRDLLLLQREPETDGTRTLRGSYGSFDGLSLRVKQARDFFLIIGPPGTGKTSYGMLNTLVEELAEEGTSVLLMSYTNRAVDEICSKLTEADIDFVRIGSELTCAPEYRKHLINALTDSVANAAELGRTIADTRVFVGTTTAINSHLNLFLLKSFSLAVIDEASQILEPHLTGILSACHDGRPAIGKFVMIGDHKQLPAVVQQTQDVSRVDDALLNGIGLTDCRLSLFERLLRRYHDRDDVVYALTRQGRMHPDVAAFAGTAFYNGHLHPVPLPHQRKGLDGAAMTGDALTDTLLTRRMVFLDVPAPADTDTSDKVNTAEADIIADIVARIYDMERADFKPEETVGIIVPYRNQIAAVRKAIGRHGRDELHEITIDTVERFQGSQRKWIVYGFTVRKYCQLNFLTDNVFVDIDGTVVDRKLNVALTRAKEHLVMTGNASLLRADPLFGRLITFVKRRGGFLPSAT